MKEPHKNLPKNNLTKDQHRRAGELASKLMSKPQTRQKENSKNNQKQAYCL